MSKLVVSSIIGLGGAAGGGIYLLHENLKSPEKTLSLESKVSTIKLRLQKEGFEILDTNGNEHWNELKTKYNEVKEIADKTFNTKNREIDETELKTLCKSVLEKHEDDLSYGKSKRWCVVPVSITEHLSKLGFTSLSLEKTSNKDQQHWSDLASKYSSGKNKIKDVDTLTGSNLWETLRDKCGEIGSKKNYEDEFDNYLSSSQSWCSAKRGSEG